MGAPSPANQQAHQPGKTRPEAATVLNTCFGSRLTQLSSGILFHLIQHTQMLHIPAFRLSSRILLLNLSIRHSQQQWLREHLLGPWPSGSPCTVHQISNFQSTWEHSLPRYQLTVGLVAAKACLMSGGRPSPTLLCRLEQWCKDCSIRLQKGALAQPAQQMTVLWSESDTRHK